MKLVEKTRITNVINTDIFEETFLFLKNTSYNPDSKVHIIHLGEILQQYQNTEIQEKISEKPAMYSNMYKSDDEFKIFTDLFETALREKKKIHIVGVTLGEELQILEDYYEKLGFLREDINCFRVDFSIPLVTVSVKIENLMWKGSDYKRMREKIFFMPPVRESSQNKALFKGINRGVVAGIHCPTISEIEKQFLTDCITQEKILPLTLGKVLFYNLDDIGIIGEKQEIEIRY